MARAIGLPAASMSAALNLAVRSSFSIGTSPAWPVSRLPDPVGRSGTSIVRVTCSGLNWKTTTLGSGPRKSLAYSNSAPLSIRLIARPPSRRPPRRRRRPPARRASPARAATWESAAPRGGERGRQRGPQLARQRMRRRLRPALDADLDAVDAHAAHAVRSSRPRTRSAYGPKRSRLIVRSALSSSRRTATSTSSMRSRGALWRRRRALQAGVEDGGPDVAAGERERLGEEREVELGGVDLAGDRDGPDPPPLVDAREREVDHVAQPPQEGAVEVLLAVGGQDRQALGALHAAQQVADLEVGVAVVRVADLGAARRTARRPRRRARSGRSPRRRRTRAGGSSRSRRCTC